MKLVVTCSVLIAAGVALCGPPASADPTSPPSPYQILGPNGPVYGGMRTLPPVCGAQPRACAGDWSPDNGTWVFPSGP
jgi:hypothetical protein